MNQYRGSAAADQRQGVVLVVDDRQDNRETIAEAIARMGYTVHTAGGGREAVEKVSAHAPDLVITDLKMPDLDGMEVLRQAKAAASAPEVIVLTAYGTVETAVEAVKEGAFNYLTKPVNLKELRAQTEKAVEHRLMRRENSRLRRQVEATEHDRGDTSEFVFTSQAMKDLLAMIDRLATAQSNVLVEGESGVGKEVVAQMLHRRMPNAEKRPFIAVHCAALPDSLIESELFGHEKGAFTGAERQLIGRIELADQGTLFLDEVGEIPLNIQVKLLRVLEQRELTRVGGRDTIQVSFRLVAATNRKLEDEVREGRFREDLYYRLNVVRLVVPPLRDRREDIVPLFGLFLKRFASEQGVNPPQLTPAIEQILQAHAWPGNVREVRNLAERVSIFAAGRELTVEDLPPNLRALQTEIGSFPAATEATPATGGTAASARAGQSTLELSVVERQTIERALAQYGGNRSAAAEALGISRRTLQRKLREYKLIENDSDQPDHPEDPE